ncbi:hypothetical protein GGR42_001499 [Saonia flava]|uniref:Uncharacterized protein n=1 Tax=Saonia flava TaxID=523696 RepID=A0A846QUZ2_9FLAO|nr:hypothetical protein [Saonia flava]NJB71037.1 hypothetical protein [Saonia flava]
MRLKHIFYILLFTTSLYTLGYKSSGDSPTSVLKTTKTDYIAGDPITLEFEANTSLDLKLILKNSNGTSIVEPSKNGNKHLFVIPKNFTKKSGPCYWRLLFKGQITSQGILNITPNMDNPVHIESYFGPRSIIAGNKDYSMLVVVPTDLYDNPVPKSTKVSVKHQFENNIQIDSISTGNLYASKMIFSTEKTGRILVSSSCENINSKEFTSKVFPSTAMSFEIDYKREHKFADGNQVVEFSTSIIKDKFDNVLSNGTMVYFIIENNDGYQLKTMGTTLNGIASAKMLHPTQKESWKIKAYITGASESNTLELNFDAAIKNYKVHISENNREIVIGPLESFMDQVVPDGIPIKMGIYDLNKKLVDTKIITSRKGMGKFTLSNDFFSHGNYFLEIKSAGITKKFNIELK